MTCRKCGYRNDFLKECPFHEPPLSERIEKMRQSRAYKIAKESMEDDFIVGADGYVAWLRWTGYTYETCDSDDEGAFKVYREGGKHE